MEQGRQYTGGGATALPSVATVLALLSTSGPTDLVDTTVFSTHTKSRCILDADLLYFNIELFFSSETINCSNNNTAESLRTELSKGSKRTVSGRLLQQLVSHASCKIFQLNIGPQKMKITCPDGSMFQDPSLQAESSVIAECGPEQYRFTLTSQEGHPVANTVKNDMFGCGKLKYFEK